MSKEEYRDYIISGNVPFSHQPGPVVKISDLGLGSAFDLLTPKPEPMTLERAVEVLNKYSLRIHDDWEVSFTDSLTDKDARISWATTRTGGHRLSQFEAVAVAEKIEKELRI